MKIFKNLITLFISLSAPITLTAALQLEATTYVTGGNVRGFGVLAAYPAGGPQTITITRQTTPKQTIQQRDYAIAAGQPEPLPDFALLKVWDPTGKNVLAGDIGNQDVKQKSHRFTIPAGPAGIWRIAVQNGRGGDRYQLTLPDTQTWGIRGEMALGISSNLPSPMYLWVPATAKLMIVENFNGESGPVVSDNSKILGRPEKNNKRNLLTIQPIPAGKVLSINLDSCRNQAIAIDGVPGLLCPTPAAAQQLQGGTISAAGVLTAGPQQAKCRETAIKLSPEELQVKLQFLAGVPDNLPQPRQECLFYGQYGIFGSWQTALSAQITEPSSPWFGANIDPAKQKNLIDWQSGLHGSVLSPFDAGALAAAATTPGKMNPAYHNRPIINRAVISAFYHLASRQGDDLLREGDFRNNNYAMTHAFFIYDGALARPLELLKDQLDPQTRKIWEDGLTDVGDKLVDFMAYESNQWSHVIAGHLATYLATGQPRFKTYFETLMTAYLDNHFGPNSKYGQHPAGYFLEEFGPDGNYDHLNIYSLVSCYYKYRKLPQADKNLVEKMRTGIAKNLYFKSFYWLPQPDGELMCPNAINCRTNSLLAYPSFPGDYLTAPEFDLGYTRYHLIPPPQQGVFPANVFPHLASTDTWALQLLREQVPLAGTKFKSTNFGGTWTADLYQAWNLPAKAKKISLPYQTQHGLWELPGQIAWKNGDLYGLVFYDVSGSKNELPGITGGGPTVIWSAATGSTICSMRNPQRNKVETTSDLTWACVYGENSAGKLVWSGKEHPQLTWIKKAEEFTIAGTMGQTKGTLQWHYRLLPNGIELTVTVNAPELHNITLSLPLLCKIPNAQLTTPDHGQIQFTNGNGYVRIQYPAEVNAILTQELKTTHAPVKCLRLTFPASGQLKLTIEAGTF